MDSQFEWKEEFKIGVEVIDKEHQKLFKIINKLLAFKEDETTRQWACREGIKFFKKHAVSHFADEEAYMESINYEGLEQHKHLHKGFRENTLPALEMEMEQSAYSPDSVEHFLGVCAGWLIGHTLIEDQAIVSGKTIKQWERLQPEEEQAVVGQAIASMLYNMFRLDSVLLSDCYGGEKFGNGIYYRLIYSTRDKKRGEFFLVFEEQLIVSTIGSVIETRSEAISVMMMNAARYTARQLVEHIMEHFPSLEEAEIKDEQLLTYEQFQKVFEKQSPQFSMLFDTGKGYFSFCMTTTDLTQREDGVSIISENAMAEVEKYLNQNKEENIVSNRKKKVLVVDDSVFMLKMMQELLGNDYEVLTATSGLSAIRSMTLDRPDLIILDYEMPVCDGSQILEMIRSEEEFADIPIIFLTSRVNRESVEKVIALKPAGYLSKSLPPESIKKEVDRFFEQKAQSGQADA